MFIIYNMLILWYHSVILYRKYFVVVFSVYQMEIKPQNDSIHQSSLLNCGVVWKTPMLEHPQ